MTLDEAVALARRFHQGMVDKAGEPYIGHPMRVMARVSGEQEKLAAVLHDLLEDTDLSTTDLLAAGCPPRVVDAVEALTRRRDETYEDFVDRVATDPLARVVKLADIADNLDPERLARLDPDVAAGLRAKYHRAQGRLQTAVVTEGPPSSLSAAGEPGAVPKPPYAGFDCATCGHPAGRAEIDQGPSAEETLVVTSPLGRAAFRLEGATAQVVAAAVTSGEAGTLCHVNPDFAPFWCPRCGSSYCDRHWTRPAVVEDRSCPVGHQRTVDDRT